jgi:penicillin-binding protein 2
MTTSPRPLHFQGWRYWVVYVLLGAVAAIFGSRLFALQILDQKKYIQQSDSNRTQQISVAPSRGIIYDRNGIVLARNIASYNIIITPANLPDDDGDIQRIYRDLSSLTGVPVSHGTVDDAKLLAPCVPGPGISQFVDLGLSNAPYEPVKIQCNVDEKTAMVVREHAVDWPGVGVDIQPVRDYPTGSLTANIVGFLGPIPAALEQVYRAQGFLPNRDKVGYSHRSIRSRGTMLSSPSIPDSSRRLQIF